MNIYWLKSSGKIGEKSITKNSENFNESTKFSTKMSLKLVKIGWIHQNLHKFCRKSRWAPIWEGGCLPSLLRTSAAVQVLSSRHNCSLEHRSGWHDRSLGRARTSNCWSPSRWSWRSPGSRSPHPRTCWTGSWSPSAPPGSSWGMSRLLRMLYCVTRMSPIWEW